MPKNKQLDAYIAALEPWQRAIIAKLRALIHKADPAISESLKWRQPAYEHQGIVCITSAHKEWINVIFYKGAMIPDIHKIYNRESNRKNLGVIKLTDAKQIKDKAYLDYFRQAVALNLSGAKPKRRTAPPKVPADLPRAMEQLLDGHNLLKAFRARAPYQQRGYLAWISQAKQDATRERRAQTMLKELKQGTYMPAKRQS